MFTSIRSLASVLASSLSTSVDSSLWPYTYKTSFIGIRWWKTSFWLVTNAWSSCQFFWLILNPWIGSIPCLTPLVMPLSHRLCLLWGLTPVSCHILAKTEWKLRKVETSAKAKLSYCFTCTPKIVSSWKLKQRKLSWFSLLNDAYWNEYFDHSSLRNQNSLWTVKTNLTLVIGCPNIF